MVEMEKQTHGLDNLQDIIINKRNMLKISEEKYERLSTDLQESRESGNISTNEDTISNVDDPTDNSSEYDKSEVVLENLSMSSSSSSSSSSSDNETDDDDKDIQDKCGNEGTGAKKTPSEFLGFISNIPITLSAKSKRRLKRTSSILYCDDENLDCDKHSSLSLERPRKRLKIPDKPTDKRQLYNLILSWKNGKLKQAREDFNSHLLEQFFLENNGHMMDYQNWLKKPSWDLLHYIKNNKLPGDDSLLNKFDGCKFYHYYNSKTENKIGYNKNVPEGVDDEMDLSPNKLKENNIAKDKKSNSPSKYLSESNVNKKPLKQKNILSLIGRLATPHDSGNIRLETPTKIRIDTSSTKVSTAKPRENSPSKTTEQLSADQNASDSDCEIISASHQSHLDHQRSSSNHCLQNKQRKLHNRRRDVDNTDFGRIVWAKLKGYPPFPAMIVNPYECGMKEQKDRVCVFWMGDTRVSQIYPLENI